MNKLEIEVNGSNPALNIIGMYFSVKVFFKQGNSNSYCKKKIDEIEAKLQAIIDEYFPEAEGYISDNEQYIELCRKNGIMP